MESNPVCNQTYLKAKSVYLFFQQLLIRPKGKGKGKG